MQSRVTKSKQLNMQYSSGLFRILGLPVLSCCGGTNSINKYIYTRLSLRGAAFEVLESRPMTSLSTNFIYIKIKLTKIL